MLADW
jgi:hypothetical protein